MAVVKIALLGIAAVLIAVKLKNVQPEYGIFIGVAAGLIIFGFSVTRLQVILSEIEKIRQYLSVHSSYVAVVIKVVGIAYISEFSSNLCRDAGYSGIASQIEMFGKLTILVMSLPVLTALLDTIQQFMG
ncbi:MAG TPA: stage III sporulation protein AD [Candidatus Onthocola gallistercoris]|uniref:Stage III sporulation protein AD n=1 Tax=Candidatus Onthocola gallistercoris TaxID=2840876 RepID=A0A9D1KVC6_9FIRM|nr:stage III sporulation protein AD [Candidatus Onthocola gallistercoris]